VPDIVAGHDDFLLIAARAPFVKDAFQLVLRFLLGIAQRGGLFEILCLDRGFLAALDLLNLRLDALHIRRTHRGLDARARTGLVHDVDGFVRQKSARQVSV
jgi:hypothetical protein